MNKIYSRTAVLLALAFFAQGCAQSAVEKSIDEKVFQESTIKDRQGLAAETGNLIEKDSALSPEQRTQLITLRDSTRRQVDEISQNNLRLRSVLIKDLLKTHYNEDEVELIKDRLSDLEEKKLQIQLRAVEQANKILGRQAQTRPWISHEIFDEPIDQPASQIR